MIITRLAGGLGNQLFQYAVARHLAEIHGAELKIDIQGLEDFKNHECPLWYHKYVLEPFNIHQSFASSEEVKTLTRRSIAYRLKNRMAGRKGVAARTHIIGKKHFVFEPGILELSDNVYLNGYWQSERYFLAIEDIIRSELSIKNSQEGRNKDLSEEIASCESVSLHIRWGYTVTDEEHMYANLYDSGYYERCIGRMAERVTNAHFFVFSDNPKWVRENFILPYTVTFVDHNGRDKGYEDMRLMSQCKHHIIANSSFSWWGAWLNPRRDKLVFAPKVWLTTEKWGIVEDLIPAGWHEV